MGFDTATLNRSFASECLVRASVGGPDGRRSQRAKRMPSRLFMPAPAVAPLIVGPAKDRRLFTAGFDHRFANGRIRAFCGAMTRNEHEFRVLLFERYGIEVAQGAPVRQGFDQFDIYAVQLVAEHSGDWLASLTTEPGYSLADGLDFLVEQRLP